MNERREVVVVSNRNTQLNFVRIFGNLQSAMLTKIEPAAAASSTLEVTEPISNKTTNSRSDLPVLFIPDSCC